MARPRYGREGVYFRVTNSFLTLLGSTSTEEVAPPVFLRNPNLYFVQKYVCICDFVYEKLLGLFIQWRRTFCLTNRVLGKVWSSWCEGPEKRTVGTVAGVASGS